MKILALIFFCSGFTFGQTIVTGRLMGSDGKPVGGAAVLFDNDHVAQTDDQGHFVLNTPKNITEIGFRFIGLTGLQFRIQHSNDTVTLGDLYMFKALSVFDPPRNGTFVRKYKNGKPESVFTLRRGRLKGSYTEFYSDGRKRVEGQYKNFKKVGKWIFTMNDGRTVTLVFQDDLLLL